MSRVLAFTSVNRGHLYTMVPLLAQLRARGHEVHLRCVPSQVDLMRSQGFETAAVNPQIAKVRVPDWERRGARDALALSVEILTDRAPLDAADLRQAIADTHPDVLIVDSGSLGACFAAEAWGGPWVRLSMFVPPVGGAGLPAYGLGQLPRPGLVGRVRDQAMRSLVVARVERSVAPRLNVLRRQQGLASLPSTEAMHETADLLMYTSAEPFEYHHGDWDGRVMMVGPMCWDPPVARPPWLDQIEGPVVLVTTSSEYQADESLTARAFEALEHEPFTVVATMPAGIDRRITVPPNGRLTQFAAHGPILDRCVAAVTHGGVGVTQKALARGVPVCVAPFGRGQFEIAARVVHAQAGWRVNSRRMSADELRRAVLQTLDCAEGAARVREGFRAAPGPAGAADAVEGLLSVGSAPRSPRAARKR